MGVLLQLRPGGTHLYFMSEQHEAGVPVDVKASLTSQKTSPNEGIEDQPLDLDTAYVEPAKSSLNEEGEDAPAAITASDEPPEKAVATPEVERGLLDVITHHASSVMAIGKSGFSMASEMSSDSLKIAKSAIFESTAATRDVIASVSEIPSAMEPVIHLRPSWNTSFSTAIKMLRVASGSISRDVSTIRLLTDNSIPLWLPTLPGGVDTVKSTHIPGEWFFPRGPGLCIREHSTPSIKKDGRFILYIHGGAFCCCSSGTHRGLLVRLVDLTQASIFAVDYRRPPEHPYPVPLDDCIAAYLYMLEKVGDPSRIIFAGDSAGGNLVVSTMLKIADLGLPLPAGGILLSPWVDLSDTGISPSWKLNSKFDYLDEELAVLFAECYRGDNGGLTMKDLSPTFAATLHTLPPLLIEVGECEVLLDQIADFYAKLQDAGVTASCNIRPDMVHVFPMYSFSGMTQIEEAFTSIVKFVNELWNVDSSTDFYYYSDNPESVRKDDWGVAKVADG